MTCRFSVWSAQSPLSLCFKNIFGQILIKAKQELGHSKQCRELGSTDCLDVSSVPMIESCKSEEIIEEGFVFHDGRV